MRLIKLNSDVESLSARLDIRSIATMIIFHCGQGIARTSGAMTAGQIVRWVGDHLPPAAA
jgi:thioredoxin 2